MVSDIITTSIVLKCVASLEFERHNTKVCSKLVTSKVVSTKY